MKNSKFNILLVHRFEALNIFNKMLILIIVITAYLRFPVNFYFMILDMLFYFRMMNFIFISFESIKLKGDVLFLQFIHCPNYIHKVINVEECYLIHYISTIFC
jgi:hypothetical protein